MDIAGWTRRCRETPGGGARRRPRRHRAPAPARKWGLINTPGHWIRSQLLVKRTPVRRSWVAPLTSWTD